MLLDKINIIGYILQMVKYIFPKSNHDSFLIVSPDNVHPLWYSDNNASVSSDPLKKYPSPYQHVSSDEDCSPRITNCP